MPKVNFTSALNRFFPNLQSLQIDAHNISDLVKKIEAVYPGMKSYLLDDRGQLRKHVNIFVGEELIQDDINLTDEILENDEVFIFQALSGG